MYRIRFLRKAANELKKIDPIWQKRIKEKINKLAENPRILKNRIRLLKGKQKTLFRLKVGKYRIIFQKKEEELIIIIVRVAHRREVY
ncbi:MAG TPA: type II toxin-antitoxin system RelE/ParE family toxin [Candidatus Cloacimonetes bacterium]|nr:type II toxin-antitoxin system RelE/ParE family toxin [Candidatus Cloacimonadota bacterium]